MGVEAFNWSELKRCFRCVGSPSVPSLAADPSGAEETRSTVARFLQPRAGPDDGPRRALRMWI